MGAYSLDQAQEQLARLVDEALTGEIVTITRDGRPVVALTPTTPQSTLDANSRAVLTPIDQNVTALCSSSDRGVCGIPTSPLTLNTTRIATS